MRKHTGEITALKEGYGFILDNEENFIWFHAKFVKDVTFDDLNIGDRVEFTLFVGPRGRRAEDVRLIGARAATGSFAPRKLKGVR